MRRPDAALLAPDALRYLDQVVVAAGERFETDDPFPISLDPDDFC